ncbi:MAG: alginate lyase family protein [Treponema sp.]|jgi:hypothetical protein|nr:alginate lyase family protein [Treponema sp.]
MRCPKKINPFRGVCLAALLAGIVCAGCFNVFESGRQEETEETGTVRIRLGDTEARTLLPSMPVFSKYSLSFAGKDGQPSVEDMTDLGPAEFAGQGKSVTLAAGGWTITATAYVSLGGTAGLTGDYPAARGGIDLVLTSGQSRNVSIDIKPLSEEGQGVLSYDVAFPLYATAAVLEILNLDETALNPPVSLDLKAVSKGTRALPAGYYILRVTVRREGNDGETAVLSDILHVYSGMTTNVNLADDFAIIQKTVIAGEALDLTALVTKPSSGFAPETQGIDTPWYTGTLAWKERGGADLTGSFEGGKAYTAVLTLTAKEGFTFAGTGANVFSCSGAETVTNLAGSGTVSIAFPALPAPLADTARIRYEVNQAGTAFTAIPSTGEPWDAVLNGVAFKTLNGRRVIDMGLGGYVDLGAQAGALLKSLSAFTIETYVYVPPDSNLNGNGHFIWTFAPQDPAVSPPASGSGRYMYLQASTQRFGISKQGWNNEQKTAGLGNIEKGIWKHLVLTRDGDTAKLYVDGILKDTAALTTGTAELGDLNYNYLARPGFAGDHYLRGVNYYRLSVYDQAFTAGEIAQLGAAEILAGFPAAEKIALKPDSTPMLHVGGLHSPEDFIRIKAKLQANQEPWVSGYAKLTNSQYAQTSWSPSPTTRIIRGTLKDEEGNTISENYMNAARSAAAAYQMALRWKISGTSSFAGRAVYILNSWADTCTEVTGDSNLCLAAGLYGYQFAVAAELLRDYSGWNAGDFADFKQWMLDVFYVKNLDFLTRHNDTYDDHYWANWDLCNLASVLAIGILTDRRDIYNFGIDYLQNGNGNGNFYKFINYIHTVNGEELGQIQESGRDQGHATMCIAIMDVICRLTWNQGDDFYGFDDNRFLKACEYVAKYNAANLDVPFAEYTRYYGNKANSAQKEVHTVVSESARGTVRPMWAGPYYHYAKVKGLAPAKLINTKMGVDATVPEGGGGDYGPNSGGFDQLGFGTLMYVRD